MKKINILLSLFFVSFVFLGYCPVVDAAGDLSAALTVSTTQVAPGGLITYNISYANNSSEQISDVVVVMDLPLDSGLTFISSSYPVELMADNRPMWRVGTLEGGGQSGLISLTISVNADYQSEQIAASASVDADAGGDVVSAYTSASTVIFNQNQEDEDNEEDSDKEQENDEDTVDEVVETEEQVGLVASGVTSFDIEEVAGGADLTQYEDVNKWDGRLLTIGIVGFVLILVVGLVAFFLGRKSS